jgi:hypothetical protein
MQDLLSTYARTVRELSLQLHIYKAHTSQGQGQSGASQQQQQQQRQLPPSNWHGRNPLQRMTATLMQYLHWLMCLSLAGKDDLTLAL